MSAARAPLSLALLVLVGACGGGSAKVVRPPATPVPTYTAAPTAAPTVTASRVPRHPTALVAPATDLVEGQTVMVTASGFTPGLALVVIECLNRGTSTGSGDCNLSGLVNVRSDAAGKVATHLVVSKGPFGTPPLLCSTAHPCLVSVTEATLTPAEEADTPIAFR